MSQATPSNSDEKSHGKRKTFETKPQTLDPRRKLPLFVSTQHLECRMQQLKRSERRCESAYGCNSISMSNCHATQRKHEGWGTARSPKPRQGKSRGRGRVRTTDLSVSKFAL
ncbi:hypothetical protein T265_09787 [Opisthorchis viverrini]|uniref:Uncharacterized protein n=1 Tax=Opisthorchis viverrini TaxID=6198 RepID=A0A074ZFM3_OPIVI|nr:hypothetical protein T265_09787 [Opisthorchis viverrini]KER22035.1 hypothetical protein T265_09787 [Opisthorchis viverrini]